MPRRARRDLESCYLHVIAQGINKEKIFGKECYKKKYYELMTKKAEDFNISILCYCIMNNHVHIIIHSDEITNMSKYMKNVNTAFAYYYNKINNRVGYVFRDRFKSQAIKDEWYLYNCIVYIHNNPVKANITKLPSEYKYSSYNDFVRKKGIVTSKTIKLIFGGEHDYIKMFEFIHYGMGDGIDVEEKIKIKYNHIVDKSDKNVLRKECVKLKELGISNRKIAKIIGIDRNKVDRLLK